ncbi:MAG TPA: D-alanine--D-alanine ligase [Dongiaceae bacterium]|jgi:hypothetical protein|nr:D-alanine--D-alanine ligase [Dongiaceae bacterium]
MHDPDPAEARKRAAWGFHDGMPELATDGRPLSAFEDASPFLFYLPVGLYWTWLSLRYLSIGLPSLANPSISAGGLCGESKSDVLDLLGPRGRAALAPFVTVSGRSLANALEAMERAGLAFPVVAKPDIGRRGSGVESIADAAALDRYLGRFPLGRRLILQRLVRDEGEAGVFYVRRPGEEHGRIVSLTLKYFPKAIGDGRSTLRALIEADPRASQLSHLYHRRLGARLDGVPAAGEAVRLVEVGNHCKGAIFRNGQGYVTPAMETAFAAISDEIPDFYFGRFDVRFGSLDDLRQGRGFTIIEVNGAGSEATHIWDRQTRLIDAYRGLFQQVRVAFEIGAANRRRGLKPMSGLALLKCYLDEKKLIASYA